jgi:hypothetical protein
MTAAVVEDADPPSYAFVTFVPLNKIFVECNIRRAGVSPAVCEPVDES